MPTFWLVVLLCVIAAAGYVLGRRRALASAGGDPRALHSLPSYYGSHVGLSVLIPSLAALVIWLLAQPVLIENRVSSMIPADLVPENASLSLVMSDVRRVAEGLDLAVEQGALSAREVREFDSETGDLRGILGEVGVALGADVRPEVLDAARAYRALSHTGRTAMTVAVLLLALGGFGLAYRKSDKDFRARNVVERVVMALLILAASLAILTTVGIVLSMLFETKNFFGLHSWTDFFFGTTWAPNFRGDSELSILPLLWGTLYISFIALLVAVPVGLFAAIYLSEYAGPAVRAFAKPLLEILAGIPTIVYGLFALLTVGPLLVSFFGQGENGVLGVEWMSGATSVLTAGLVMGIMLIPFVSSLSDDIINAVPQSMRDGSLGLGATKSETVRQVVLPAALPGIVGAVLLAASRAIGETMIVVMGAGAIAKFSLNPLESMTTITTRIVSQLTGDTDFASPETLVAFALGLTLFVLTLGLNVLALYIVRKYREQYD
ncbi:phosphate ABC transporter permease subunit PstC [Phaeobacter gallaeciensis]|uniref:phosphate ABC transporter permease subunit PstC n=1 Tax=Phaeobacter gallaeciensis TaxID=60890 RepID=UPI00237F30F6|nr:phosphate ABC transporter permease subunit PstC [Phaeobacter gallaeciensis]MDE4302593.1 phosphate ABC transporter permease subunit PstC [Phaeobacter gallaeciensis]MDE4307313.1 phosphate ABC transporter permease subunit PstC [Phaeobacter gallaeciensis]MDE4311778.1 phosphate ABC transporter permease subunit PstC [Phaeobacter gallaeciensis]MDE4315915.1 phosphate ABC transporter permease subunit PstC [Phaeobacter gallaeciensis]MDE4320705.1 phosphate ABC transporter permease subunit PstC [Phaeob